MNIDIHNVKNIVKGEMVEHTKDRTGEKFYTMTIVFSYDELGTCKERYSDNTMWGDTEIDTTITLYAETRKALEIKARVLTTEEG